MKISELAKLSGVSPTAVSLVLNGRECRISQQTKDRIKALAKQYNYSPNHIARNLVMKKSNTIGFMITDLTNPFFATLTKEVEKLLTARGLSLMLSCTNGTIEDDLNKIDFLCNRGVDGLLVTISAGGGGEYNAQITKKLNGLSVPFIAVDRWLEGLNCPRVSIDHETCGYLATKYLLDCGHRRIAIITGPNGNYTAKRRFGGYIRALSEQGYSADGSLIFEGDFGFDSGYLLGDSVSKSGATAAFACNDMMATGLMRRLGETGVSVPEDISIIGVDDIFFAKMLQVPLTTVKQNLKALASAACEMLIHRTKVEDWRSETEPDIKVPAEIVVRSSVKPPKL